MKHSSSQGRGGKPNRSKSGSRKPNSHRSGPSRSTSRKQAATSAFESDKHFDPSRPLRNTSDRLILEQASEILPGKALLILVNGSALARRITMAREEVQWKIFTFEHFYLQALTESLSEAADEGCEAEIDLYCNPDLPEDEYDSIVMPTDSRGTAEVTRDLLQNAERMLKPAGRLLVSTNNPRDHWLNEQLKDLFGRVTVIREKTGICYVARKKTKPVKQKNFDAEFAFRDGETLVRCLSRPGVFSHRRVDAGARALIKSMDLLPDKGALSQNKLRTIVDLGCGCGSVAAAAAIRCPQASVLAVDSHARAVHATQQTAELNNVENVSVMLTSNGVLPNPASYDLFLCNPPYYSDFRISEIFLQSADEAVRAGGRIHLVTKLRDVHRDRMQELFGNAEVHSIGDYDVIVSTQPNSGRGKSKFDGSWSRQK